MAKKKSTRSSSSQPKVELDTSFELNDLTLEPSEGILGGETTGRMIMLALDSGKQALNNALKQASNLTGLSATSANVCSTEDFDDEEGLSPEAAEDANYIRIESLNIAIVKSDPGVAGLEAATTTQQSGVIVEPEFWNYPLGREANVELGDGSGLLPLELPPIEEGSGGLPSSGHSSEYLLGCRAMIDLLLARQQGGAGVDGTTLQQITPSRFADTQQLTWGLQATRVQQANIGGQGVRVAVLDTGFDIGHPDFHGRTVHRRSFIPSSEPDNSPDDLNGHGTHCIGTSCGPKCPGIGPRYGIAYEADIYSGKVLRQGRNGGAAGADGWILAGIDWALRNRCHIISMSLGSRATSSQFPQSYERAAQVGLRNGTLIVAATGNDSKRRFGQMAAVGRPANCPSIAAVSAVDERLRVADFSNGQRFGNGGEVNFAAPGVNVLSSVPMPRRRAVFDGTSMATPHVAGLAALIHQQTGSAGIELYRELRRRAQNLGNRRDFGNGLAQF